MMKNLLKIFVCFLFLYACLTSVCLANIRGVPSFIEMVANEKGEAKNQITIANDSASTENVRIELIGFDNKQKDVPFDTWCRIEPREFRIKSGEAVGVDIIVNSPKTAEGELRCRIRFCSVQDGTAKKQMDIGVAYNIPLYVLVQGTVKIGAEIKSIDVKYNESEILGNFEVENAGNVHIRPYINFTIEQEGTDFSKEFTVPYGQVVPRLGNKELMFKEVDTKLLPGKYNVTVKMDYGKQYGLENFVTEFSKQFEVK